jgi:hypothetical protein
MSFGQVAVRVAGVAGGFDLRHVLDAGAPGDSLRPVPVAGLRRLALSTLAGAFRPLKSAPTLAVGWRCVAEDDRALELALNALYPGAVADWFAAESTPTPVTDLEPFLARQSGMYAAVAALGAEQSACLVRACCHLTFCLKRRLWRARGLEPEAVGGKSMLCCLEPCALLLEFARTAAAVAAEEPVRRPASPAEWDTLRAVLESQTRAQPELEADFGSPSNPRRARLMLERLELTGRPKAGPVGGTP